MKVNFFGAEEKTFKDKKDGREIVYYRGYGFKPTKQDKGVGGVFCELRINKDCYDEITTALAQGKVSEFEVEFDEYGRVVDWVVC